MNGLYTGSAWLPTCLNSNGDYPRVLCHNMTGKFPVVMVRTDLRSVLKIIDAEVMIDGEGFTQWSGTA